MQPLTRTHLIVAAGVAALDESPSAVALGGGAARVALAAVRRGHRAAIVSRIGQDERGDTVLSALAEAGVETTHVQRDPDHDTPRVLRRPDGTPNPAADERETAAEWLQWDHDLEDVARRADSVVFGLASWRGGQSRSEERRLLDAAETAIRIAVLPDRSVSGCADAPLDRTLAMSALDAAQLVVADRAALRRLTTVDGTDETFFLAAVTALSRARGVEAFVVPPEPGHEPVGLVIGTRGDAARWTVTGRPSAGAGAGEGANATQSALAADEHARLAVVCAVHGTFDRSPDGLADAIGRDRVPQ
ncbi:MAG: PfkB family carbohydrate kinase [Phycisphaerales bacterium]